MCDSNRVEHLNICCLFRSLAGLLHSPPEEDLKLNFSCSGRIFHAPGSWSSAALLVECSLALLVESESSVALLVESESFLALLVESWVALLLESESSVALLVESSSALVLCVVVVYTVKMLLYSMQAVLCICSMAFRSVYSMSYLSFSSCRSFRMLCRFMKCKSAKVVAATMHIIYESSSVQAEKSKQLVENRWSYQECWRFYQKMKMMNSKQVYYKARKKNPKQPAMNLDLLNEYHPLLLILCYV